MKNVMFTLAALCIVLAPCPVLGFKTAPCHLRLAGRFVSPRYDYDMQVAVRLTVHGGGEGPGYLSGRMRCTSRNKSDCFLADGTFNVDFEPEADGNHIGGRTGVGFTMPRRGGSAGGGGVCELEAVTGYSRRNGCFGALIGTFVCPPEGVVPVSGNFGWTVDTCKCRGR